MEQFGIDWEGPVHPEGDGNVSVPETGCPLSADDWDALLTVLDPLADSPAYGIELFEQMLQFVLGKIENQV